MTTSDSGTLIVGFATYIDANGNVAPFAIDPASAVTLLIQKEVAAPLAPPPHETYAMAISADGFSASYTTVGNEFPVGGMYNISMRIMVGASRWTADQPIRYWVDPDFFP